MERPYESKPEKDDCNTILVDYIEAYIGPKGVCMVLDGPNLYTSRAIANYSKDMTIVCPQYEPNDYKLMMKNRKNVNGTISIFNEEWGDLLATKPDISPDIIYYDTNGTFMGYGGQAVENIGECVRRRSSLNGSKKFILAVNFQVTRTTIYPIDFIPIQIDKLGGPSSTQIYCIKEGLIGILTHYNYKVIDSCDFRYAKNNRYFIIYACELSV
jgi:hypothetical protein